MSLTYEAAYHLHCGIVLESGRTVVVEVLSQARTYAGVLEGVPIKEVNDRLIASAARAAGATDTDSPVVLFEPPRRDYFREPGDRASSVRRHRVPEWLPNVQCSALLRSSRPASNAGTGSSYLHVVWFQDEYAPPIVGEVLARIRALDWSSLAVDESD